MMGPLLDDFHIICCAVVMAETGKVYLVIIIKSYKIEPNLIILQLQRVSEA